MADLNVRFVSVTYQSTATMFFAILMSICIFSVKFVYSEFTCPDLPEINNGLLILNENVNSFRVNDSISYECQPGFISLDIDPKALCVQKNNSTFWDVGRGCTSLVNCGDPGDVENAVRIGNVFTFPFNVTYKCKEGFKMIGSGVKFCSKVGSWQPPNILSCEAIYCPTLTDPLYGKVLLSSKTNFNSIATFKCNRNYKLIGNSLLICQNDETWNGTSPTCEAITCPDPGKLPYGVVIGKNQSVHTASSIVIFRCFDGTHVSSKCLESGEWNVSPPVCSEVDGKERVVTSTEPSTQEPIIKKVVDSCEDPGKIKNGDRTFMSLHINSTVTYTCDEGYELRGKAVLLCLETGKWDLEKLPICVKPVSVPTVIGIVFGIISVFAIVGGYLWYRYRVKAIRRYGEKSKALTADATDLEEITGLDRDKKPIPVTVL